MHNWEILRARLENFQLLNTMQNGPHTHRGILLLIHTMQGPELQMWSRSPDQAPHYQGVQEMHKTQTHPRTEKTCKHGQTHGHYQIGMSWFTSELVQTANWTSNQTKYDWTMVQFVYGLGPVWFWFSTLLGAVDHGSNQTNCQTAKPKL